MALQLDLDRRWWLLVPDGAVLVTTTDRRAAIRAARALPANTTVVMAGGRRLHSVARRSGLTVLAEYIALPSLTTPVAITQIAPDSLRWTARTMLTVPSGVTRWHAPLWFAVRVVRARPGLLAWVPTGDRIVVGARPR